MLLWPLGTRQVARERGVISDYFLGSQTCKFQVSGSLIDIRSQNMMNVEIDLRSEAQPERDPLGLRHFPQTCGEFILDRNGLVCFLEEGEAR